MAAADKKKPAKKSRIPELDGLRVLMIFIVSWYHFWQQSWLTPGISIPEAGISWSLDFLVRTGYIWVDGTVLLSAFLLYLPLARQGRSEVADLRAFYVRKGKRLLPAFWFIILLILFAICLPWNLYGGNGPYLVKDLFTHMTLIFPYFRDTYIYTPMGAASWTLSVVAQGYLVFPLLAKGMRKHPAWTLSLLAGAAFAFRAWCLWALQDYSMVVNTFVNFLDVYAAGFGCALLFARLEKAAPRSRGRKALIRAAATLVFFLCLAGLYFLLNAQARNADHSALQAHQQIYRTPFALLFAGLVLSAPRAVRPLRFLLGNRVTAFLAGISMNYYLIHQTLAVHLKRLHFPAYTAEYPNMAGEQPWQTQYTWACFGLSLLLAALITYLVEKPAGKLIDKWNRKKLQA